jgi:excisionase family DNA binding protein
MEVKAKLLTVDQFAEIVGLRPVTVRMWAAGRKIASVKLGRALRIPATELDRLIELGLRPAKTR